MTEEQRKKAEMAIFNEKHKQFLKWYALKSRNECLQEVSFYRLPYGLIYKLRHNLREHQQPDNEIRLNPFYPKEKASESCRERIIARLREIAGEDKAYFLHTIPPRPDQQERDFIERQVTVEEETKEYTPENKRDYFFTSFLEYCDIDGLKNYELTGNPITLEEETKLKMEYKNRLKDYHQHPERYSPRLFKSDDKTEYWKPDED